MFITTSEGGITLENGRFYPWAEVTSVRPLEVKLQIYAAPTPGLTLHFKDGKEVNRILGQHKKEKYIKWFEETKK